MDLISLTKKSFLVAGIIGVFATASLYAAPKVTASLDSAYLLMGKQTVVHVETNVPQSTSRVELLLPRDTLTDKVEIIDVKCDTGAVSNGIQSLRHDIIIQSFDSGLYALPPIPVLIDNDTALSNHLILKVIPVNVDSLNGEIHQYAGVISPERNFWDFIPNWLFSWIGWALLTVLILALGFAAYYFFVIQKRNPFKKTVVVIPPYEEAIAALHKLQSEHLCENGHEREYYTRLTDILRIYLFRRFNISAMEMTSTQILRALSDNQETKWSRQQIQEVLSMADFVKFAKMRPLPDDNIKTFRTVENFVENTKPVPETEATDSEIKTTK